MKHHRLFCTILVSLYATCVAVIFPALADDGEHVCEHGKLENAQWAAEAGAFDEASGRDLRNFPPDRMVDFQHMKLQMKFNDLNEQKFSAYETLTFTPIGRDVQALKLDAVDLKISSVKLASAAQGNTPAVEHSHDGKKLVVRFEPALSPEKKYDLLIEYVCDHPTDGMFFTPYSPDAPQYTAEVHTQGQTDTNRYWFVSHDFPNERMATELIVDVPAGFSVSSNGKLVSNLSSGDRTVWHYLQEKPHVSYLVTLIIGKFDIVDLPPPKSMPNLPMKVWVAQGLGDRVLQTYGRTGEMIDMFNDRFGVLYPWDRYDQLCAKNFRSGGMENTSATTMYPTAILDKNALLDGDIDGLISHELCHQWTGDYITCKSWAHIWLNEGWATYGSALWNEQRFGQDAYLDSMRGSFGVARRDRTTGDVAMVSPVYEDPGETFRRPGNPYPKGASILHMLRMKLGDDVFWNGVRLYMNRHALGVAETNDFRYAMEEVSGLGLEWFFEQWCYRPGCPELNVKIRYEGDKRDLYIDVEQAQKIDAATPAFRFTLPVVVRTPSGEKTISIDVSDKTTSYRTTLDGVPSIVAVDPSLHVLKTITEEKPVSMWVEQAKTGPTIAARHAAIDALSKFESSEHIALLAQIIRDDKQRHTLRNSAADALATYTSAEAKEALLAIVRQGVSEARVRANLVDKLRRYDKVQVLDLLTDFATNDASYATRVEAIGALAHLKATDRLDQIVELVNFESQSDQVRNAALRALCDLEEPRGLDLAIRYSAYGFVDRSRPTAISSIARLAKHDKDKAVTHLLALLNDHESRAVSAAGSALADIGDSRAIAPIRSISESHRDQGMRTRAAEWLKKLEEPQAAASGETPAPSGEPPRGRRRSRTTE